MHQFYYSQHSSFLSSYIHASVLLLPTLKIIVNKMHDIINMHLHYILNCIIVILLSPQLCVTLYFLKSSAVRLAFVMFVKRGPIDTRVDTSKGEEIINSEKNKD